MHSIRFITIPEVDSNTNVKQLFRMARQYPLAELTVSLKDDASAKDFAWIKKFSELSQDNQTRSMLELSHSQAVALVQGDTKLNELASEFGRIRLNFEVKDDKFELQIKELLRFAHSFTYGDGNGKVLIPYSEENSTLCQGLRGESSIEISMHSKYLSEAGISEKFFGQRVGFTNLSSQSNDCFTPDLEVINGAMRGRPFWLEVNPEEMVAPSGNGYDIKKVEACLRSISVNVMCASIESGQRLIKEMPSPTQTEDLDGYWLNWWCAMASGYKMSIPEKNASRPTYMHQGDGTFHGIEPLEYAADAKDMLDSSDIGCIKKEGRWNGVTSKGEMVPGDTRELAMLRALVVENFGHDLPANPATHPKFQREWVGQKMVTEELPALFSEVNSGKKLKI